MFVDQYKTPDLPCKFTLRSACFCLSYALICLNKLMKTVILPCLARFTVVFQPQACADGERKCNNHMPDFCGIPAKDWNYHQVITTGIGALSSYIFINLYTYIWL